LAYLRLASAVGLPPLRIPVPLILLTAVAWAVMLDHAMLHHAINMSEPMGSAGGVLDAIAMFGLVWSYAGFVVYLLLHAGKDLVDYLG
jgi:hypothetical protein